MFLFIAAVLLAPAVLSGAAAAAGVNATGPAVVKIGIYVVDFTNYNPETATFETNYYLSLSSDAPVNISDFEMANGHATAIGTLSDTPQRKYYRVFAAMEADQDFRRYPFDRHTLPVLVEPKLMGEHEIVFAIDEKETGLDAGADIPGWSLRAEEPFVTTYTYQGEAPYSRAVFPFTVQREPASTVLKFFLPVFLIVLVSLTSLLMRVTSRLGLNASMFLAAVLIHWRVADAIPTVPYATFLDLFMIVTYGTLVMVLISGILVLRFSEEKDLARADAVYRWSLRLIPALCVILYAALFATLLL